MDNVKLSALKKSFIISIAYVGLGTLSVLSVYPSSPTYGLWSIWGCLLTLPVNFISFGIEFTDSNAFTSVIITQTFVLFIFWLIVYKILIRRKSKINSS